MIVANQHGKDTANSNGAKFEYREGAIEDTSPTSGNNSVDILNAHSIRDHICLILEGGTEAFKKREKKYGYS